MSKRRSMQVRSLGTPKKVSIGLREIKGQMPDEGRLWLPLDNRIDEYPQIGRWVQCIDYDNHRIFLNPEFVDKKGTDEHPAWFAFCSCSAPAQILGYNAYKAGASVSTHGDTKGEMVVCSSHVATGKHQDGSS